MLLAAGACLGSCDSGTEPANGQLVGSPPLQVEVLAPPRVEVLEDRNGELVFVVSVTAIDSLLHASWRPTRIEMEIADTTDVSELLVPSACIVPSDRAPTFPLNFDWYECDVVFAHTERTLTAGAVQDLESAIDGRIVFSEPLSGSQGHFYRFRIPVGRAAVDEAIAVLRGHGAVIAAGRTSAEPTCVLSDEIPPPPCPPWRAVSAFRRGDLVELGALTGDTLRLFYTTGSGDSLVSLFVIPPFP